MDHAIECRSSAMKKLFALVVCFVGLDLISTIIDVDTVVAAPGMCNMGMQMAATPCPNMRPTGAISGTCGMKTKNDPKGWGLENCLCKIGTYGRLSAFECDGPGGGRPSCKYKTTLVVHATAGRYPTSTECVKGEEKSCEVKCAEISIKPEEEKIICCVPQTRIHTIP
jgi:hypothetical protein